MSNSDGKDRMNRRGLLVVISSPSGAGKTTLCRKLMDEFPALKFSVSYTTRTARAGERNGVDYNFVDGETFDRMVAQGDFAEWAEVHGNRYGTTVDAVRQALDGGRDVLFDIDYQGGRQIKARFGREAILVFVLPPSLEELERRLRTRATDAPEVIERRLAKAKEEIAQSRLYEYLVVNDEFDKAAADMRAIIQATSMRVNRPEELVRGLLSS